MPAWQLCDCLTLGTLLIFQLLLQRAKPPACPLGSQANFWLFWGVCSFRRGGVCRPSGVPSYWNVQSYVHTPANPMLGSEKLVDGDIFPQGVRTHRLRAQCKACFLRAAGGNVSRRPWLGEAGCPSSPRSSMAPCTVVSALHFLSSGDSKDTLPPLVLQPFRKPLRF